MSVSQYSSKPKGSIFWAATEMVIGGFVLSFIPFFGGLIAGIIGGKIAGTSGRGVMAALIPALLTAGLVLLLGVFHIGIAIFVALGAFVLAAFHLLGIIVGAFIGGLL